MTGSLTTALTGGEVTAMYSTHCPNCRHELLHRGAPAPAAGRCTNPSCGATFDPDGRRIDDTGPWPDPDDIGPLEGTGNYCDQNTGATWSWQTGSSTRL